MEEQEWGLNSAQTRHCELELLLPTAGLQKLCVFPAAGWMNTMMGGRDEETGRCPEASHKTKLAIGDIEEFTGNSFYAANLLHKLREWDNGVE